MCKRDTSNGYFGASQPKGIHISLLLLQEEVTALMIAVYHDHSHIVEVLIRFKSDVNLQTKVGVVIYVVYIVNVFAVQLPGVYD